MKRDDSLWMVIQMAHSSARAEAIRTALEEEGFLVRIRPVARILSSQDNCYEIMVPAAEAKEARDLLVDRGL